MKNFQVADCIIRLKNAALAKRRTVEISYSNLNKKICNVLVKEGYLEEVKEATSDGKKTLQAKLVFEKRTPVLTGAEVITKPSLRVYAKAKDLQKMHKGRFGVSILSTNNGIMTENEAKKKGVGGEILFRIW